MMIRMWREDRLGELFGQGENSHGVFFNESGKLGGVKIYNTDINIHSKKNSDREPIAGCTDSDIPDYKMNFKERKKREKIKKICCSLM